MALEDVVEQARAAKDAGASRFCMGAAWRSPKNCDLESVGAMVAAVKALGLKTCATLGMLTAAQAQSLKESGLDYYNHNLDTSPEFYDRIITTRTYQERLGHARSRPRCRHQCLLRRHCRHGREPRRPRRHDRDALRVCRFIPNWFPSICWSKSPARRLPTKPRLIRSSSCAPSPSPASYAALDGTVVAGREDMSDEMQALCFLAGANSIFYGSKLLTTPNPGTDRDLELMERLGLTSMA